MALMTEYGHLNELSDDEELMDINDSEIQQLRNRTENELRITEQCLNAVVYPFIWLHFKRKPKPAEDIKVNLKETTQDFCWKLSGGAHILQLLHDTAITLQAITDSAGYIIYIVDDIKNELYICPKDLHDKRRYSWPIKPGTTIAAYVAHNKSSVIARRFVVDNRFPDLQGFGNFFFTCALSAPIVSFDGTVYGVLEFYRENEEIYNEEQLEMLTYITKWIGETIFQNIERAFQQMQNELNHSLLQFMQTNLNKKFSEADNILKEIVRYVKIRLDAQCVIYFSNKNDTLSKEISEEVLPMLLDHKKEKLKTLKELSIASLVLRSGVPLNIRDAYNDPRFSKHLDQKSSYIIRSVISLPIMEKSGFLGVIQIQNKNSDDSFNIIDENILKIFSQFFALGLHYITLCKHITKHEQIQILYEDIVFYHILNRPTEPEIYDLDEEILVEPDFFHFSYYNFFNNNGNELVKLCYYMIDNLCGSEIVLDQNHIYNFLFNVKRSYRNYPYHNFEHAFNTMHATYYILTTYKDIFEPIEKFGMLLAALCHDIDHRGLSGKFYGLVKNPIATIYENSPLEMHHIWFGTYIVQISHILDSFTSQDYKRFFEIFNSGILATDLMNHILTRTHIAFLSNAKLLKWDNEKHRDMVRGIILTAADLSVQTKSIEIAKKICQNLYEEYFHEGEIIKNEQIILPKMMDPNEKDLIPDFQIQFITVVCVPCYSILKTIFPLFKDMHEACIALRDEWKKLRLYF